MPPVRVEEQRNTLFVGGGDWQIEFDRQLGTLSHWSLAGRALIKSGPRVNLWRAPTDNDGGLVVHVRRRGTSVQYDRQNRGRIVTRWLAAGYDRLIPRLAALEISQPEPQVFRLKTHRVLAAKSLPPAFRCIQTYTVYGTGDVVIRSDLNPLQEGLPDLPRFGLQLVLPLEFDSLRWYGRGPHENYDDRKESAFVGAYCGTVAEQLPYIRPQEYGNKADVRWAVLSDRRGMGLLAVGMPLINVSAHRHSTEDLTWALHAHELPRRDEIYLNLDYRQGGLGSNSCGPRPLAQYLLLPEPMSFSLRLRPLASDADAPWPLSRRPPEEYPQ